ncbi:hypothetical protein B0O99DRAFT_746658 [Bisporella sp. PMI_857]|nr:hypothetical protein B0O99DRAFT_746658 [Bisporella sp. PMI_857]
MARGRQFATFPRDDFTTVDMKAPRWDPAQKKVVVNDIPIPEPGEDQLLVKLASASLYHSVMMAIGGIIELQPANWLAAAGCGGLGQLATQYAKAMSYHVVGIDINDTILAECKAQGTDAVSNSITNKDYVAEVLKLSGGGVKTSAVYSNAEAAYAGAPALIKLGGILIVVGIAHKPLQVPTMDLCLGSIESRLRAKASFGGWAKRLNLLLSIIFFLKLRSIQV